MEANPNTHNFSAKIGDEGGLHVTSGQLHFPSQAQTFICLILKSLLENGKLACMYIKFQRKGGREEQVAFSVVQLK